MSFSPLVDRLLEALRVLPGVGPRTAQRMALHLLERERDGGRRLVEVLGTALEQVGYCQRCRTLTEEPTCTLCRSARRDGALLCIVESPADMLAIEDAGGYHGHYFVLHGHLSPLDGIGPDDIGLARLDARLDEGGVEEVILATNLTVEGQTTAHYIIERLEPTGVAVTRLAHGVPVGGELDYLDDGTLMAALQSRQRVQ